MQLLSSFVRCINEEVFLPGVAFCEGYCNGFKFGDVRVMMVKSASSSLLYMLFLWGELFKMF